MSSEEQSYNRALGPDHKIRSRISLATAYTSTSSIDDSTKEHRVVAVRYFLDRPGYSIRDSAARLWHDPPPTCRPQHLRDYLVDHGIALPGLLVEVYLDKLEAFMSLDACENCKLEWDFCDTTPDAPGIINIRLTDLVEAKEEETISELDKSVQKKGSHVIVEKSESTQYANVTQVGLFSFSMMVGLETLHLTSTLVPGSVSPSYIETWGPYMFFVGGLMQLCVAIFQVLRNNVYGATAFFGFGCFWFSTGLTAILQTYSCASEETLNYADDDWGGCVRSLYILGFSLVLLIQTFTMNKLSTTLISLLCAKVLASAFSPWSRTAQWFQFVFGWATSFFAFFVFMVETTNSIYHRDVFPVFRYSEYHSPQEVFGKSGRSGTLHSRAAQLRQAKYFPARVRTANQARDNLSGELSERFRRSLTQEKQSLLSSQ